MTTKIPKRIASVVSTLEQSDPELSVRPPALSDDALALLFADRHQGDLRYTSSLKQWRRWDETRWGVENTLLSFDFARQVGRQAAAECSDERLKKTIASASTVANIERLARSDRRLAATPDQFDANPWLLNTPDGVLDLQSGEMRRHRREDYQTKITTVGPRGKCPRWREFIRWVTNGDDLLAGFLARVIGYSLTGSVREHALFFCHGLGGNGKGVFTETSRSILGDYATPAPMQMFTASRVQAHSTDVAGLQGARLVLASETDAGNFLDEAKVKLLTGGDQVSARKMRADNTSYSPQFKLMLSGNRKPHLRSDSEAMRRRLHIIPFDQTISDEDKDPDLAAKLRDEWPGILQWAVEGCADWQQRRLAPPDRVIGATTEYLRSQDTIGEWIAASVSKETGSKSSSDQLFMSYRKFVTERGEQAGNIKDFVADLESKGFVKKRGGEGYRWQNVRLIER